jgi:hypothetical protein
MNGAFSSMFGQGDGGPGSFYLSGWVRFGFLNKGADGS